MISSSSSDKKDSISSFSVVEMKEYAVILTLGFKPHGNDIRARPKYAQHSRSGIFLSAATNHVQLFQEVMEATKVDVLKKYPFAVNFIILFKDIRQNKID